MIDRVSMLCDGLCYPDLGMFDVVMSDQIFCFPLTFSSLTKPNSGQVYVTSSEVRLRIIISLYCNLFPRFA